jgi:vitamin B12 transporter
MYSSSLKRFALLFASSAAFLYASNASIEGTVQDSSGAAVSGATVTVRQETGSLLLRTESDAAGSFRFPVIAPGNYLLNASAPGLEIDHVQHLVLASGAHLRVNVELIVSTAMTETTVTAADAPQSIDEVSKQLDIVDPAHAERRGLISVPQALQFTPGVQVISLGGPGMFSTIHIRGMRAYDTGILFDGFRFRDPTSVEGDASAYIGDLMLVDSSRIEVLEGSGSSLYGTNSIGGTVNIITDPGGGRFHGDVDLQGGGLGLFRGLAQVSGGGLRDRLLYSAGVSNLNVSGGVDGTGAVRDWSAQSAICYLITPSIRIGADLFANAGYLQETVDPYPIETAIVPGIIPAAGSRFVPARGDPDAARYSHFLDSLFRYEQQVNSKLSLRAGYNLVDVNRDNTNGPAGPDTPYEFQPLFNTSDRFTGRIDTLQARADYLLGSHQAFTAGYEFERERYLEVATDQNPDVSARVYNSTSDTQLSHAVFAQDQLKYFGNRLEILLSGRYTHDVLVQPAFFGGVSPYAAVPLPSPPDAYTGDASIAYFFRKTATKVRAHAGNSFRMPSIYERFGGFFYGGFYYPIGDPDLAPERAVSGDIGIDQYALDDKLRLSATYYYSELQQVIGYLSFPPGYTDIYGRTGGYYNTSGGISRGVEIAGEYHPVRRTSLKASYTYTNAKDRVSEFYTGIFMDPLQMPGISPNTVSVVATQQFGAHLDAALDFVGGDAYLYPLYGFEAYAYRFRGPKQLGISAGYSIPVREGMSLRFYGRVSNVLNQEFFEEGFPTPGRWAVGGMRLNFQ